MQTEMMDLEGLDYSIFKRMIDQAINAMSTANGCPEDGARKLYRILQAMPDRIELNAHAKD